MQRFLLDYIFSLRIDVVRKIAAFALLIVTILSCSYPDDFGLESTEFVYAEQKWGLIKMTGSFVGSESTGDEMDCQESYLFTPNGTFIKSRIRDEVVTECNGTFEVIEYDTEH
ncbi:hypothetical protein [Maribacter sp. ACAM166]|uniref:hypothetical protein n=1 Tax=Maribacter sp. ACAM166 TaxID=2508996 RepID=UPI0010FE3B0E|nr:hypothetical protein [Maribacter sp. ACAM166]TLP82648.1 hypothetical protein ES765_00315 [Maribacter sp. ACAM166]